MADGRVLLQRVAVAAVVGTFVLMMLGGYVKAIHAGLACPDWPTCYGVWFPFGENAPETTSFTSHQIAAEWLHRYVASMVGVVILAFAWLSWRVKPVDKRVRFFATATVVLLPIQVGMGGWTVLGLLEPLVVTSHLGFATLIFGCLVAATAFAHAAPPPARAPAMPAPEPSGAAPGPMTSRPWTGRLQQALGPWVELVKPGILLLLVLCGGAAMALAGTPSLSLVGVTLLGGALAAGSAAAFNNYLDRDRDAQMARTRKRSIPSERVDARWALAFAFALEVASFAILWRYANLLTALCALAGILFYVFYTVWLKPTTAQNIVIGGAAGAAPALVGWAAVTGEVGLPAVLLGFIIFAWTPPHFWALALVYKSDYANGPVPMHPVVKGEASTRRQIVVYAVLTVAATLLFVPLGVLSVIYGAVALALGAWFVWLSLRLLVRKDNKTAYGLFAYSIVYLALLFGAMVADRLLVG
ncbi:MAG TPA: heme o synthase [Candidatus Thermoplasmatota archaeon]|nr:heme o synthase [Candidatus Thermoplasmatota archaeon]